MAMQSPPASPSPTTPPGYVRVHVWSATLAAAVTALLLGLIAWPIRAALWAHAWRHGAWRGMTGAPAHPMMAHPMLFHPMAGVHLLAIVVVAIWAGIGGAVFAALYNAFAPQGS